MTVVAFHAHPDDEVLLTGGTLARLAAHGRRVVIVVACAGMGPAESGAVRLAELAASAQVLGAARVVHLGYADSGHGPVLYPDPPGRTRFARAGLDEAAGRLAAILREEHAQLLLSYDAAGGNGHRDHVRVHEVGARAAELARVRVLEATLPREPAAGLLAAARGLRLVVRVGGSDRPAVLGTPRADITHRVSVRKYAGRKQAALAAHRSQVEGRGRSARLFRVLTRLPAPAFGLLLGREWFTEPGAAGGPRKEPPAE